MTLSRKRAAPEASATMFSLGETAPKPLVATRVTSRYPAEFKKKTGATMFSLVTRKKSFDSGHFYLAQSGHFYLALIIEVDIIYIMRNWNTAHAGTCAVDRLAPYI